MKEIKEETTTEDSCFLCGKVERGVTDLRCVRIANDGHFWDGYYKPRLSPEEKWLLKDNKEHYICTNRQGCKERKSTTRIAENNKLLSMKEEDDYSMNKGF